MSPDRVDSLFNKYKENALTGRYICNKHIHPLLEKFEHIFKIEPLGDSVLGKPIVSITVGKGKKRILMWSQMHGNEATTTKAIFDLLNFLNSKEVEALEILKKCTIKIIPILNPDGAEAYTRINANEVDLNRDAQDLSQPESVILRELYLSFKPHYCYNLHGQRTIFSAGVINKPATVSFLSPSQDEACTITENRKIAMEIIAKMNSHLQKLIPEQVGIYDDSYNINCVGDVFQSFGTPTILFEAGHFPGDYQREKTKELIFHSYLISLLYISQNELDGSKHGSYQQIPMNDKLFYDIILRNVELDKMNVDVAIQYQEVLENDKIKFSPKIEKIGNLESFFGHKEIDVNYLQIFTHDYKPIYVGYENDFVMKKNEKIPLNAINI